MVFKQGKFFIHGHAKISLPGRLVGAFEADYTTESKGRRNAEVQAEDWALDCI
jgi:hypothetical protein